ncbi:MAG: Thioredoxin-dependent thiol peroxidase [Promethearchaeota archaeon]|nr:MAG: Thioredoxin-dependent thiol peroxidase [Candidatus Lokiarchaeota archaeon]
MREYQEQNNLHFSQISDKNAEIAEKFDIEIYENIAETNIKSKQAIPSKFLINNSGKIMWKYIAETKTDRPDIETILNAIKQYC